MVKIAEDVRNDRHYIAVQGGKLSDMTVAAEAVAKSAGCAMTEVEFRGNYGRITAEFRVSLTLEQYRKRSGF